MHPQTNHQFLPCFYDLFLTLPPTQSRQMMRRIDALDRADRNHVLEEFDRRKEVEVKCRSADGFCESLFGLFDIFGYKDLKLLLDSLLEQYWRARRELAGGYYLRYLPDPMRYQSFDCYCRQHAAWINPLLRQMTLLLHDVERFEDLCEVMERLKVKG